MHAGLRLIPLCVTKVSVVTLSPMPDTPAYADDDMVTVVVGADLLRVHPNTLRRWALTGKVPSYRSPGNRHLFRVGDLRAINTPVKASA